MSNPQSSIFALNVGSSSIKFALFAQNTRQELGERLAQGALNALRQDTGQFSLTVSGVNTVSSLALSGSMETRIECGLAHIFTALSAIFRAFPLIAVGHRIVHGGEQYTQTMRLTPAVIADLQKLTPLAPLHEPFNLMGVGTLTKLYPDLPQYASFDTAFHAKQPRLHRLYGLPQSYANEGIVRYGFHGLSYEAISRAIPQHLGAMPQRLFIAHLGSGASICALDNGRSIGSSLGFSTLEGLIMSTRCGHLDAGLVLFLLQQRKMTVEAVHRLLYQQSGLLGISGVSAEMHELINTASNINHPQRGDAQLAIDLFCHRASVEMSSWLNVLGGVDALVFSGGIGENAPLIRQKIAESFAWLGLTINRQANENARGIACALHGEHSRIKVWSIPTDEERVIAQNVLENL